MHANSSADANTDVSETLAKYWKTDLDEDRADVAVLEFDRLLRSVVQNGLEAAPVFALVERLAAELMLEHDEVVRDCRGNFFRRPGLRHACVRRQRYASNAAQPRLAHRRNDT